MPKRVMLLNFGILYSFQHAHFIPILSVGKKGAKDFEVIPCKPPGRPAIICDDHTYILRTKFVNFFEISMGGFSFETTLINSPSLFIVTGFSHRT